MVSASAQTSPPPADRVLGWMASLADATRVRLVRLHELGVVDLGSTPGKGTNSETGAMFELLGRNRNYLAFPPATSFAHSRV